MKAGLRKPFPRAQARMQALGERLKLARLRRQLPVAVMCARMPCSKATWQRIEAGDPGVAMGRYDRALELLGLADDLDRVALDDALGRRLQDYGLKRRARAPRKSSAPAGTEPGP